MEYSQLFHQAPHRLRPSTNIIFFQHAVTARLKPVQTHYTRGSDPVAACCRFVIFQAIFSFTTQSPSALFLSGFSFSALCRCQGSGRLKPFYLTIMVQTGSQSQQNSSQLVPKHFLYIFFFFLTYGLACCSVLAPVSRLPSRSPNGFDRSSDSL